MRFFLFLAIFLLIDANVGFAQTPLPSAHPVKDVERQMQSTKEREKKLKKELNAIKSDLKKKKNEMVSLAKEVKANENKLIKLEKRIGQKRIEQKSMEKKLEKDRGAISDLVLALQRVERVPPEAIIARPGAPLETAQSAMLLHSVLPRVYDRAEALKTDLNKLNDLIDSLKKDRKEVLQTSKTLEKNHKKLSGLLDERESLYKVTAKDVKKQQAELKQISQEARSLKDLVRAIERKQREEDARRKNEQQSKTVAFRAPRPARTPVPKAGQAQLPASGLITVGYGKSDDIGALSKGLTIQSRANALVVAPMGGVVDYAGTFKGYGEIIILKHQKGYHSLIAGLGKIDTVVGRAVSAGEPIGKIGSKNQDGSPPTMYYELRYKGNPVNPSKKISGLK